MKYHALFVISKKRQNLKLWSAANYRWRFKGQNILWQPFCLVECNHFSNAGADLEFHARGVKFTEEDLIYLFYQITFYFS